VRAKVRPGFAEPSEPLTSSPGMRLAHVAPTYAPCIGGSERLLQAVSERLVARGNAVTVLTLNCATQRDLYTERGAGLPARETINGVAVIRVAPGGSTLGRLARRWTRFPGGWRTTGWFLGPEFPFQLGPPSGTGLVGPLLRLNPQVISSINWHFGVCYWAWLAARLSRRPHVAVPVLHIDRDWAARPIYRRMLGRCASAIVGTEAEAEFVRARGARRVIVAGAGVDPARFEHKDGAGIRRRHGLGEAPVVAFVGRQDELKGVPLLLDAMRLVWSRYPDARLLLAGPAAHRDQAVRGKLSGLPESERQRVVVLDDFPDEEGSSVLDACDVLALPSVEESFGLVLLEAWMCGKPVVAADIATSRCVVDQGSDGWLVRPFDVEDLAGRILELLANPELRAEFGRRGREKVLARYTWERVTDAWEAAYRQVLNLNRGGPPEPPGLVRPPEPERADMPGPSPTAQAKPTR